MERFRSNSDLYRSRSNTSGTQNGGKRQNMVLSTSFVSTRRFDDGVLTPTSPLLTKHRNSTVNNLKGELLQLEQELSRQRKKKSDNEKFRQDSNINDIYVGKYSTDHLERHSMRLRANSEIRDMEKNIKKLQEQIKLLKLKLKRSEQGPLEALSSSNDPSILNAQANQTSSEISDNASEGQYSEEADYKLSPTKSVPTTLFQSEDPENNSEHNSFNLLYESPTKETATWLISDHLQSLQDMNASVDFILQKANGLIKLLQKNPDIKEDLVITAFANTIQNLLLNANDKIRSAGYRIVRYLIIDENTIDFMFRLHIDVFIAMSLGKDITHQEEREQALKLVRKFLDFQGYGINKPIMQSVISCIEAPEDPLRLIAFETLIELAFIYPALVDECRAYSIVQAFILDPSVRNEELALNSMIEILSYPQTRGYFIKNFHTGALLSGFSDYQTKLSGNLEKVQRSSKLIIRLLQNFNGVLLFALNECELLRQLISFAQSPLLFKHVITIFASVFRIQKTLPNSLDCPQVRQYVYLLVVMLNKVDFSRKIMQYVVSFMGKLDNTTKTDVRLIMAKTFEMSMQLAEGSNKLVNSKFPENINQYKLFHETFIFNNALISNRSKLATTSTQQAMLKSAGDMQLAASKRDVDEMGFKKMVYDSKVLQTKNFKSWNWQVIGELCRSPLMNKKRLDELAKSTKFIRRMLVFYRPFRFRFTSVSINNPMGKVYVDVGCAFFRMLLSSSVGFRILNDDTKIIPQVASVLYNNMHGNYVSELLFTETALAETMCAGYFKMIFGVFMENKNGMSLLEKWNVFTVINNMFFKRSICLKYLMLLLPELNLKHSRCKIFLNKALIEDRETIRTASTEIVGQKLQNLKDSESELEEYLLRITCRQLYDLSPKVVAIADKILYDYCSLHVQSSKILQVSIKNCLDQLIFIGSPTLLKLMETSEGFQQLNGLNYVSKERSSWKEYKNKEFVLKAEQFLEQVIRAPESLSKKSFPLHFYQYLSISDDGANLLNKFDDVRQFITVIKNHINSKQETFTEEDMIELKSCLWACGFISSTENGIMLLDKYSFVQDLIDLAYGSPYTTIKQTAFYVLGLISYTMDGREMLEEVGWDSVMDLNGSPIGVSVPKDGKELLHWSDLGPIEMTPGDIQIEWKDISGEQSTDIAVTPNIIVGEKVILLDSLLETERSEQTLNPNQEEDDKQELERVIRELSQSSEMNLSKVFDEDKVSDRILRIVSDMGNNILLNGAIKEITSLEAKYGPSKFQSPEMFEQIFQLMGEYRFKPSVRKFLLELFINNRALENLIRNERRRKR